MKVRNFFLSVFIMLVFTACGSAPVMKKVQVNPPFDHNFIKAIAVIEFSNSTKRHGAGKILADRVEQLLINESGYRVVNRMDIDQIRMEKNIAKTTGLVSSSVAKKIGRLLKVDALVVGHVENYLLRRSNGDKRVDIVLTFKILNTTTGRVIWSKTAYGGYYSPKKNFENEFTCREKAIKVVMKEVRRLFPHVAEEIATE